MITPFFNKLERFTRLSRGDRACLDSVVGTATLEAPARSDILREGDKPRQAMIVVEGWCTRYKTLEDGRRQIVSLILPGDVVGLDDNVVRTIDYSVGTLTPVRYVELGYDKVQALRDGSERIRQAFVWIGLVQAAIQQEWIVNLGQRESIARLAHLFCEVCYRLSDSEPPNCHGFDLPLTQTDLAEATGMTAVHANRMVQELRSRGLIRWRSRSFEILDLATLAEVAMFQPAYLHLNREGRLLDARD